MSDGLLNHLAGRVGRGDIGRNGKGLPAGGLHQGRRLLKLGGSASNQGHIGPGVGQSQGHAQPQPPATAGHQGYLAVQP